MQEHTMSESFDIKKLEKIVRRNKVKIFFKSLYYSLRNFWSFRKEIWRYRTWDYRYNLNLFARSIELTADAIEKYGIEEPVMKEKRINAMRKFVWYVQNMDNGIELAEKELGPMKRRPYEEWFESMEDGNFKYIPDDDPHTKAVFKRSDEIEKEIFDKMWKIIIGSDKEDGTGIRGWWD